MAEKDDKGRFAEGNTYSKGRPPGSPNVTSKQVIQRFLDTLYSLDDTVASRDWLKKFATENPAGFIKALQQCLPRQVEQTTDITIKDDRSQPELIALINNLRTGLLAGPAKQLEDQVVEGEVIENESS